MNVLINAANVLILLSFVVRDILWLRLLSVSAGVLFIVYFSAGSRLQLDSVAWNAVFVSLNLAQVARLLRERRPVCLSALEQRLHDLTFRALDPRAFASLLRVGEWVVAAPRDLLVDQGQRLDVLLALAEGRVVVEVDARTVAELGAGRLVGEMSFLTGAPTSARVVALEPTRYIAWRRAELRALVGANPELRAAFQLVIGQDLAAKLQGR